MYHDSCDARPWWTHTIVRTDIWKTLAAMQPSTAVGASECDGGQSPVKLLAQCASRITMALVNAYHKHEASGAASAAAEYVSVGIVEWLLSSAEAEPLHTALRKVIGGTVSGMVTFLTSLCVSIWSPIAATLTSQQMDSPDVQNGKRAKVNAILGCFVTAVLLGTISSLASAGDELARIAAVHHVLTTVLGYGGPSIGESVLKDFPVVAAAIKEWMCAYVNNQTTRMSVVLQQMQQQSPTSEEDTHQFQARRDLVEASLREALTLLSHGEAAAKSETTRWGATSELARYISTLVPSNMLSVATKIAVYSCEVLAALEVRLQAELEASGENECAPISRRSKRWQRVKARRAANLQRAQEEKMSLSAPLKQLCQAIEQQRLVPISATQAAADATPAACVARQFEMLTEDLCFSSVLRYYQSPNISRLLDVMTVVPVSTKLNPILADRKAQQEVFDELWFESPSGQRPVISQVARKLLSQLLLASPISFFSTPFAEVSTKLMTDLGDAFGDTPVQDLHGVISYYREQPRSMTALTKLHLKGVPLTAERVDQYLKFYFGRHYHLAKKLDVFLTDQVLAASSTDECTPSMVFGTSLEVKVSVLTAALEGTIAILAMRSGHMAATQLIMFLAALSAFEPSMLRSLHLEFFADAAREVMGTHAGHGHTTGIVRTIHQLVTQKHSTNVFAALLPVFRALHLDYTCAKVEAEAAIAGRYGEFGASGACYFYPIQPVVFFARTSSTIDIPPEIEAIVRKQHPTEAAYERETMVCRSVLWQSRSDALALLRSECFCDEESTDEFLDIVADAAILFALRMMKVEHVVQKISPLDTDAAAGLFMAVLRLLRYAWDDLIHGGGCEYLAVTGKHAIVARLLHKIQKVGDATPLPPSSVMSKVPTDKRKIARTFAQNLATVALGFQLPAEAIPVTEAVTSCSKNKDEPLQTVPSALEDILPSEPLADQLGEQETVPVAVTGAMNTESAAPLETPSVGDSVAHDETAATVTAVVEDAAQNEITEGQSNECEASESVTVEDHSSSPRDAVGSDEATVNHDKVVPSVECPAPSVVADDSAVSLTQNEDRHADAPKPLQSAPLPDPASNILIDWFWSIDVPDVATVPQPFDPFRGMSLPQWTVVRARPHLLSSTQSFVAATTSLTKVLRRLLSSLPKTNPKSADILRRVLIQFANEIVLRACISLPDALCSVRTIELFFAVLMAKPVDPAEAVVIEPSPLYEFLRKVMHITNHNISYTTVAGARGTSFLLGRFLEGTTLRWRREAQKKIDKVEAHGLQIAALLPPSKDVEFTNDTLKEAANTFERLLDEKSAHGDCAAYLVKTNCRTTLTTLASVRHKIEAAEKSRIRAIEEKAKAEEKIQRPGRNVAYKGHPVILMQNTSWEAAFSVDDVRELFAKNGGRKRDRSDSRRRQSSRDDRKHKTNNDRQNDGDRYSKNRRRDDSRGRGRR